MVLVELSLQVLNYGVHVPVVSEVFHQGGEPGVSHASATRITAAAAGWAKSIFLLTQWPAALGINDSLAR